MIQILLTAIPITHTTLHLLDQLLFLHLSTDSLFPLFHQALLKLYSSSSSSSSSPLLVSSSNLSCCSSEENQLEERIIVPAIETARNPFAYHILTEKDKEGEFKQDSDLMHDMNSEGNDGDNHENDNENDNDIERFPKETKGEPTCSIYSHLLQIISTHFDHILASPVEEMETILSLGWFPSLPNEFSSSSLNKSMKKEKEKKKKEAKVNEDLFHCLCENQYLITSLAKRWISHSETMRWHPYSSSPSDQSSDQPHNTTTNNNECFQFDKDLSSDGILIDCVDQSAININPYHRKQNIAILVPSIDYGSVECVFRLEEDRTGDEMVCFGVCSLPLDNLNYETSPSMWTYAYYYYYYY